MARRIVKQPTSASDTRPGQCGSLVFLELLILWAVPSVGAGEGPARSALVVPVEHGKVRVTFATAGRGSKTLVVITPMAGDGAGHSIRLSTEAAAGPPTPLAPFRLAPQRVRINMHAPNRREAAALLPPASHRSFWLLVRDGDPGNAANYRSVDARLRAVGRRVQVYVDPANAPRVSDEALRMLVHTFDDVIEPRCTARFGPASDVDGDGRLTVLLTTALGELAREVGAVDGLMRGADFDRRIKPPLGNQCDVVVLNADVPAGGYLQSILAHEYTHAVVFSRRVLDPGCTPGACEEASWLDEALAHVVEASFKFSRDNLDHRVDAFLTDTEKYRLVVDDYYSTRLFRSHGHRGASYLFLDWCVSQFGPDLLDALVRAHESGMANLEHASGARFADLYRAWSVALFVDPCRSGEPAGRLPQHSTLDPGGGETWRGVETASHYCVVRGSDTGAVMLTVDAPPDAELQVTLIPLPDEWPSLVLRVEPAESELVAQLKSDDTGPIAIEGFDATARVAVPTLPAHWETLTFERLPQPLAAGARHNVVLRLPAQLQGSRPLWLRVRGRDAAGRPVAAWCTIDRSAPGRALQTSGVK